MRRRHSRSGMTLIEVMAALSVSGLVLIGGILLLDQLTDSGARITRAGTLLSREANGARVMRQLFSDTRVTADSLDRFRGDEHSAEFSTTCQHPGGWLESCRVTLAIDQHADSAVLTANLSTGEQIVLEKRAGHAELRYFDALATDTLWASRWASSIAMPLAIGVVIGTDTAVHPLGTPHE